MSVITTVIDATIDLDAGVCHPRKLHKVLVWGNNLAHEFRLFCQRNEQDVELVNATVTLYCTRADGVTVTVDGEAKGNVASAKLSQQCYEVEGPAQISMEIAVFESRATHAVWNAMVVKTQTATIAEGGVVPSVGELLSRLEALDEVVHVTLSDDGTTASHTSTELVGLAGESKQPLLTKDGMVIPYVGTDADGNAIFRQMQYDPATQTIIEDEVLVGTDGTASYTRTERALLKNLVDGEAEYSVKRIDAAAEGTVMNDGETEYHIAKKAFALGTDTRAAGVESTVFGLSNEATGIAAFAAGTFNEAHGGQSVAMGFSNKATGEMSFAMGEGNEAAGESAVALGHETVAKGNEQTVIGRQNVPDEEGKYAFIVGNGDRNTNGPAYQSNVMALGWNGELEVGKNNTATGENSAAIGANNKATANNAIAMGLTNTASGAAAVAMGGLNHAEEQGAVAMGLVNKVCANGATAFGVHNEIAEGATGALAAGMQHSLTAPGATAFGTQNDVSGENALAANVANKASGAASAAFGRWTQAQGDQQVVIGRQNVPDPDGKYAFIIGNSDMQAQGTSHQSNGLTVDWQGNVWFPGKLYMGGKSMEDGNQVMPNIPAPTAPYTHLASDGEGKAVWTDLLAYKTEGVVEILPETYVTETGGDGDGDGVNDTYYLLSPWKEDPVAGNNYNVIYNGVPYECPGISSEINGIGVIVLGKTSLAGLTGGNEDAPFAIMCIHNASSAETGGVFGVILTTDGAASVVLSITGDGSIYHKIPKEYLPDEVVLPEKIVCTINGANSDEMTATFSGSFAAAAAMDERALSQSIIVEMPDYQAHWVAARKMTASSVEKIMQDGIIVGIQFDVQEYFDPYDEDFYPETWRVIWANTGLTYVHTIQHLPVFSGGYHPAPLYIRYNPEEKWWQFVPASDVQSDILTLTSPNGTKYKLSVADDGTLTTTAVE